MRGNYSYIPGSVNVAVRAKAGLEEADRQLDKVANAGPNADVAAAINSEPAVSRSVAADPQVTQPSNTDFVPENDFEADPDFDPTAQPINFRSTSD